MVPSRNASDLPGDRGITRAPAPWAFTPQLLHEGQWTTQAAIRYCTLFAEAHYENFPVTSALLRRPQRQALAAIYAFSRSADDFADEPEFQGQRDALLDTWEDQLRRAFDGYAVHPVFIALVEAIHRFGLSMEPFLALIDAFRQDCHKDRYATFDEVLDYCRRSADPVGRIVLKVLGLGTPQQVEWSDRICTALQLTNFWQDLSVDLARNRLYLPLADLERFQIPVESIFHSPSLPAFGKLLSLEIDRTRQLFEEGRPLLASAGYPGGLYFGTVWLGGKTVLKMVEEAGTSILSCRPALGPIAVGKVFARAGLRNISRLAEVKRWTR